MFRDKSVGYYERLRYLGLTALDTRRLRARDDIIEVFKMFKGFEDVDYTHFFTLSQSQCRGHQYAYKLYKPMLNLMQESYFFHFVLLMCGILYLRSNCSVVPYKRSSVIWTCVCIIYILYFLPFLPRGAAAILYFGVMTKKLEGV